VRGKKRGCALRGAGIAAPTDRRSRHARSGAGQRILEKIPTAALRGSHLPNLEYLRGLVGMLPASDFRDPVIVFLVSHDFFLRLSVSEAQYRIPGSFASAQVAPHVAGVFQSVAR
jgi:hypothetical protein